MNNLILNIMAWAQSERGEFANQGLLITILVVLAIVAVAAWLLFNVGVHEK